MFSKALIENLPSKSTLYLANSTAIRSFDYYASTEIRKDLSIIAHRGISGIEGLLSASCGYAESAKKDLHLIIGDISFLHDLNALTLLKDIEQSLTIWLLNNGGGGIFGLLPFENGEKCLPLMKTEHNFSFEGICQSFHLHYQACATAKELPLAITKNSRSHRLIEIKIDDCANRELYQQLKTVKL